MLTLPATLKKDNQFLYLILRLLFLPQLLAITMVECVLEKRLNYKQSAVWVGNCTKIVVIFQK